MLHPCGTHAVHMLQHTLHAAHTLRARHPKCVRRTLYCVHATRGLSGYMFFMGDNREKIKAADPDIKFTDIAKVAGAQCGRSSRAGPEQCHGSLACLASLGRALLRLSLGSP